MSRGSFPEVLSQRILVGMILVGDWAYCGLLHFNAERLERWQSIADCYSQR